MANASIKAAFSQFWLHVVARMGDLVTQANNYTDNQISAVQTTVDSHKSDTTVHVTSTERASLNAAKTHADSAHAPSNAQVNQNAFSYVKIGDTSVAADNATDTLTLAGSNVTITPDAANDKITFSVDTVPSAEKLATPIDITIGKKTLSMDGSQNIEYPLCEVMGSIETPSSGTDNKGKWVKFATFTLSHAWDCCSGILNFTKIEGSYGAEGVLSYYFRNGASTSTTDISLSWISLNNEDWSNCVAAVKVSDGKFDLYYKAIKDYESVLITAINTYNPSCLIFGTGEYVNAITSEELSVVRSYAKSAHSAAMLQTYKPGSTTETYGEQYPLLAQWEDENTLKLFSEDSTTKVDQAETATNAITANFAESSSHADYASVAGEAEQDGNGNVITDTYATISYINEMLGNVESLLSNL